MHTPKDMDSVVHGLLEVVESSMFPVCEIVVENGVIVGNNNDVNLLVDTSVFVI